MSTHDCQGKVKSSFRMFHQFLAALPLVLLRSFLLRRILPSAAITTSISMAFSSPNSWLLNSNTGKGRTNTLNIRLQQNGTGLDTLKRIASQFLRQGFPVTKKTAQYLCQVYSCGLRIHDLHSQAWDQKQSTHIVWLCLAHTEVYLTTGPDTNIKNLGISHTNFRLLTSLKKWIWQPWAHASTWQQLVGHEQWLPPLNSTWIFHCRAAHTWFFSCWLDRCRYLGL